ncbi:MAG: AAA family ATPase, partial [Enterobacterales bacterium]|nr:AAA family ATPase [Enterobacterales bacterium]
YFGLSGKPFSIAPDPRYLFMSEQHREALAHLVYGVGEGGGFVLLTGEVGTGKTTVCRCLLEQLPDNTQLAFILNPKLSATELLETVCDELHIETPENPSLKDLNDRLNAYLLDSHATGKNTVLMIDEAQNLSTEVLEQIRLLTNLETNKQKLLQIILIGQPELKDLLAKHELRQLAQRITARYHLRPLTQEECPAYIHHRLSVSGYQDHLFEDKAIEELYRRTGGVPRLINVLCDRAMLGAYAKNRKTVDAKMIKHAASEIMGGDQREQQADVMKPGRTPGQGWRLSTIAVVVLLAVVVVLGFGEREKLLQSLANEQGEVSNLQQNYTQLTEQNLDLRAQLQQLLAEKKEREEQLLPFLPANIKPTNRLIAYAELLSMWGLDYNASLDGDVCDYVLQYQRRCEVDSGTWEDINLLDRPVILELISATNQRLYGVVTQVSGEELLMNFDGKSIRLSRQQLAAYWNGNYAYVWATPPDYQEPLKLNTRGLAVQWLKTGLAKLADIDLIVPPNVAYDEDLQYQVLQFQQKYGLEADAVAGPATLIMLNSITNSDHPSLSSEGEG